MKSRFQHLLLVFLQLSISSNFASAVQQNDFAKYNQQVAQLLRCPQVCAKPCNQDSLERGYLLYVKEWEAAASSDYSASKSSSASLYYILHLSGTVCKSDNVTSPCLPTDTNCQISSLLPVVCGSDPSRQTAAGPTTTPNRTVTPQTIDHVLSTIEPIFQQLNCTKYFDSHDVLHDVRNLSDCQNSDVIPDLSISILARILSGQCIRNATSAIIFDDPNQEEIFQRYGVKADHSAIDEYGLKLMVNDLGIHQDGLNVSHKTNPQQATQRNSRSIAVSSQPDEKHGEINGLMNYSNNSEDLTVETLMFDYDVDNSHTIDITEFLQMCPYFINKLTADEKGEFGLTRHGDAEPENGGNQAMAYGLGTVAVLIVSASSIIGFFILPCLPPTIYEYTMAFFIALAYGTLFGDGLLHLLPEALGLESFVEDDSKLPWYFWKLFALMLLCYILFVLETVSEYLIERQSMNGHQHHHHHEHGHHGHHGHSHVPNQDMLHFSLEPKLSIIRMPEENGVHHQPELTVDLNTPQLIVEPPKSDIPPKRNSLIGGRSIFGLTALAWMIIVGDGIHNVADGLAIGAAFSSSTNSGLATSLAVLFHEIPHELGDFAILISTGLSFKKALLLNFVSALTAFAGLYIGVAVGSDENVTQWIFISTAAIFITVAMGSMLPEMKNIHSQNKGKVMIAQNFGALLGMASMTLMAVYEGSINFD